MNIERLQPISNRRSQQQVLARTCFNLANQLTGGRWRHDKVRTTHLERSIVERQGLELLMHDVGPFHDEVLLSFRADKYLLDDDLEEGSGVTYTLNSSVSQDIKKDDIPRRVMDEIFEEMDEDDELSDLREQPDDDGFEQLEITRQQETEYTIDEDGEVEEYSSTYKYFFDNQEVHEVGYSNTNGQVLTVPIRNLRTLEVLDARPLVVPPMDEETIRTSAFTIDEDWRRFLTDRELKAAFEFSAQPLLEHRRRAMSMIALLTSGIIPLSDLTRRV